VSLWWYLAAAVLGGVGATTRVWVTQVGETRIRGGAPMATALINIAGAAAIGVVVAISGDIGVLVVGGGLLGGFTTFSTWMVEADEAARTGRARTALLIVVLPLALGALAYAAARAVA